MTMTDRILVYITYNPGRTAWDIAKAVSDEPKYYSGAISSLLRRMAGNRRLWRRKNAKGSWTYRILARQDGPGEANDGRVRG